MTNLICKADSLAKATNNVRRVLDNGRDPRRHYHSLIAFSREPGQNHITLYGHGPEASAISHVPVLIPDQEADTPCRLAIPSQRIVPALTTLATGSTVILNHEPDNTALTILDGAHQAGPIPAYPSNQTLPPPAFDPATETIIAARTLQDGVAAVAACRNGNITFSIGDKRIRATGQSHERAIQWTGDIIHHSRRGRPTTFSLPASVAPIISPFINQRHNITILWHPDAVAFATSQAVLHFPQTSDRPKPAPRMPFYVTEWLVDSAELSRAVTTIAAVSPEPDLPILLQSSSKRITVQGATILGDTVSKHVPSNNDGLDRAVSLRAAHLLAAIDSCAEDTLSVRIAGDADPVAVRPQKDTSTRHLLKPILSTE